jgi:tyrosyl-tRNA synthetase
MDIDEIFMRGVNEIIDEKSLKERMAKGKLRIKYGVDPTKPDIHLGHAVVLWKLKKLQDMGHIIIFLIGDYTTKIGDPSGRNSTRPVLSDEEIKTNAKTYLDQVGNILDITKTEIRYNSEWFNKMNFSEILQLAGKFTVAQIIERDDFAKRLKEGSDISLHEILYPLMQAQDSVELKADVEIGGSDQKFNILAGRDLQKKVGQTPQEVIFVDLLVGTDGNIKMSKSVGNYISITDLPNEMFGKIMSIPDELIIPYFELCTLLSNNEIGEIKEQLNKGENPRSIKAELAKAIIALYYSEKEAQDASNEFDRVFKNKEMPRDIRTKKIANMRLDDLLVNLEMAASKSDARRLVEQGAVYLDDEKQNDPYKEIIISKEITIKAGPRNVMKVLPQ